MGSGEPLSLKGSLMVASQATGADAQLLKLSPHHKGGGMNVGMPSGLGSPFGVANVIARLGVLSTKLALGHGFPLTRRNGLCKILGR